MDKRPLRIQLIRHPSISISDLTSGQYQTLYDHSPDNDMSFFRRAARCLQPEIDRQLSLPESQRPGEDGAVARVSISGTRGDFYIHPDFSGLDELREITQHPLKADGKRAGTSAADWLSP